MKTNETVLDLYPSRVEAQPRILERKDPVVYPNDFEGPLGKDDLAAYERDGYLFAEQFFTPEETEALQAELRRLLEGSRGERRPEVILEPDGDEVRSIFAVHRDNAVFKALSEHPKLVNAARQILGSDVYVHQSRINFKPGFKGKEFQWHSDFETWHTEDGMPRMRALSCSIALSDNYPFNGPLMVIPGSHRHFVACVGETPENNYENSLRRQEIGVPDEESLTWLVNQSRIEQPAGKAGSVVFFDCNIMHGSNSNITPYPRSNAFFVFNSVENKLTTPFAASKPRPDYIATRD
ncbi:ectoine hydroxylase [Paenibacillus sp.]|uniref:ectoine hydroxylase n=1 Tax=Paenibacillus sp. TaxID=58172 RepID=UPI002D385698|nr:ectoine hydroxylase [Paenibacillus sp.]HZG87616.1 ectoine hydroxylase [Paenibacillus sp.]